MKMKSSTYVIILTGGYGTRLKPLSYRIPKPLIEIAGIPIVSRVIKSFKSSRFIKFCVLVGYKKELVKKELLKIKDIEIIFVEQSKPTGMADAISLCVNQINSKKNDITEFFVTAVDILFSMEEILKMYSLFNNSKADIILSLMKSHDIEIAKGHGNVKISMNSILTNENDTNQGLRIIDVIEKPKLHQILSNYYSLPLYLFNQKFTRYLKDIVLSERGENEFQDAIKKAIDFADDVRGIRIIETLITKDNIGKYHLTNLKDIIEMNNRFLSGVNLEKFKGKSPEFLEPVKINFGVEMGNNVLLGPYVIIGKYCKIGDFCDLSDIIIFDNTIIGKSCKLNWCIIDENIKLPDNFHATNCFITKNDKKGLDIITF